MFDVGRICVKLAGRDAGKKCVIVQKEDEQHVLIDGQTRRRKCNVRHLEPTQHTVDLKEGASHDEVKQVLEKASIQVRDTKPKQAGDKPVKRKRKKEQPTKKPKKQPKKEAKEQEAPAEKQAEEAKQALAGEESSEEQAEDKAETQGQKQ